MVLNAPIHKEDMNSRFFTTFFPYSNLIVSDWFFFFHDYPTTPSVISNSA